MKKFSQRFRPYAKRGLYERFQRTCKPFHLAPKKPILIGLSGGRDSVVLLHLLLSNGYSVVAAHLNHQLRGRESNHDETFVRDLCKKWKVPLVVERSNIRSLAKRHRLSIEESARIARYRFFAAAAKKKRLHQIFLAHHERDQAETVLLRIFQGCNREHLRGMQMKRPLPLLDWKKGRKSGSYDLIRPLLETPFEEIVLYAKQNRLPYREDSSNRDLSIQRNWIRHRLLPLIEKNLNRNVVKTLARLGKT